MVFVAFNPFELLAWITLAAFIPGILLALGIFRKSLLETWEKIITGCALGMVFSAAVPFLLFLFGNIAYSYSVAMVSTVILYAIAIVVFVKQKAHEEFSEFAGKWKEFAAFWKLPGSKFSALPAWIATFVVILLVVLNFWIRLQSYSPLFYELDPYFYTYGATQLLTLGETPFDDQTGWYPEARSSHRAAPLVIYMESLWYSLSTHGEAYNVYLLSDIANVYPPLAAAFAVFFVYLFVRLQYTREAGLAAAGIVGFIPIFLTKTLAGEMEVQPYGFFAIAFFLAMYVLAMKTKQRSAAVMAGIAYATIVLGSSSQIVAMATLIIFLPLQALLLFFKEKQEDLMDFLQQNAIVIFIGPLLGEVLKNFYVWRGFSILDSTLGLIGELVFVGLIYYIRQRFPDREIALYAVAGLLLLGGVAFVSPLGQPLHGVIEGGLSVAEYNTALQRTIAEQGVSGSVLEGQLGFLGATLPKDGVAGIVPAITTGTVNTLLGTTIGIANTLFGTSVLYANKDPAVLFVIILLFLLVFIYSFYRAFRLNEPTLLLLVIAALFPASLIGILKEKFTIFTGFLMAALAGVVLGEMVRLVQEFASQEKNPDLQVAVQWAPLVLAVLLVYAQYGSWQLPQALLANSALTRFQDNPAALKEKFTYLCDQLRLRGSTDPAICAAAQDPMGYASRGTLSQYDTRLCLISLVDPPSRLLDGPPLTEQENWAIRFRCQNRLNDYWVESMEWIAQHTEPDARITSWWDYGHWTNLFGQRNTVLRNEHLSLSMIGEVAHDYIEGTPEELRAFMQAHDSKYALFDQEILFNFNGNGERVFGGKYGALNYLACARNNRTSVAQTTGVSQCENEYLWEIVYVPKDPAPEQKCTVSESAGISGVAGYYSEVATLPDGTTQQRPVAVYCVADQKLADGTQVKVSYKLDQKDPAGNLVPNRGILQLYASSGQLDIYTMYYTNDLLWMENGTAVGGYSDHKGKFYESNLYRAFVLEDLPGFDLVFKSSNGEVKIFKIRE